MLKGKNSQSVNVPYRQAVGLMYIALWSRPDILYAVNIASQHIENVTKEAWNIVKRILKYLKGTIRLEIIFEVNNNWQSVNAYSDADFANDLNSRKSTTGYVIKLGNYPVIWKSKKQAVVSLSTTESEFLAACETVKEIIWLRRLICEIVESKCEKPVLHVDNQSAIRLIKNPEFHQRTKHIDVKYCFIRENYNQGCFELKYVKSEEQLADILTKPLSKMKFASLRNNIGVKTVA